MTTFSSDKYNKYFDLENQVFKFYKDDKNGKAFRICNKKKDTLYKLYFLDGSIILETNNSQKILAIIKMQKNKVQESWMEVQLLNLLIQDGSYSINFGYNYSSLNITTELDKRSYQIINTGNNSYKVKDSKGDRVVANFTLGIFETKEGTLKFEKPLPIDAAILILLTIGILLYKKKYSKKPLILKKSEKRSNNSFNFFPSPILDSTLDRRLVENSTYSYGFDSLCGHTFAHSHGLGSHHLVHSGDFCNVDTSFSCSGGWDSCGGASGGDV